MLKARAFFGSSCAPAEVGDGAVEIALVAKRKAAVVERQRIARVELQRLIEVGDGAIVVALLVIGVAAVVEREALPASSLIACS